jgi:hypothetical protein
MDASLPAELARVEQELRNMGKRLEPSVNRSTSSILKQRYLSLLENLNDEINFLQIQLERTNEQRTSKLSNDEILIKYLTQLGRDEAIQHAIDSTRVRGDGNSHFDSNADRGQDIRTNSIADQILLTEIVFDNCSNELIEDGEIRVYTIQGRTKDSNLTFRLTFSVLEHKWIIQNLRVAISPFERSFVRFIEQIESSLSLGNFFKQFLNFNMFVNQRIKIFRQLKNKFGPKIVLPLGRFSSQLRFITSKSDSTFGFVLNWDIYYKHSADFVRDSNSNVHSSLDQGFVQRIHLVPTIESNRVHRSLIPLFEKLPQSFDAIMRAKGIVAAVDILAAALTQHKEFL